MVTEGSSTVMFSLANDPFSSDKFYDVEQSGM
jgi:hypothetical protein